MALGAIMVLPLMLVLVWAAGRWILSPLRKAALEPRPPVQFLLTDMYILSGLILIFGLLIFGAGSSSSMEHVIGALMLCFLIGLFWWQTVRLLSFGGIREARSRAVVLGFGVPLVFVLFPLTVLTPLTVMRISSSSLMGDEQITEDYFMVYGVRLMCPSNGPIISDIWSRAE